MHYRSLVVGPFQANCYLLGCLETRAALVIDPGGDASRIAGEITSADLKPVAYLLTHGHVDHVGAASTLKERLGGEIIIHQADLFLYERAREQALAYGIEIPAVAAPDRFVDEGDEITWGNARGEVFCTPGHSPGGICLRVPGERMPPLETAPNPAGAAGRQASPDWVFTGDTLFMGSIGRTDLPGGSYEVLMRSIKERLLALPDETVIASGHGPLTTLAQEKRINPFVQELL
jgi:glyoxylase-like metal-dependent hydrolase (beta-lactamase superfamily II)